MRAGGALNLVAPTRRAEVDQMTQTQMIDYLADDPARLRRPIIDVGHAIFVGFGKDVRQMLAG